MRILMGQLTKKKDVGQHWSWKCIPVEVTKKSLLPQILQHEAIIHLDYPTNYLYVDFKFILNNLLTSYHVTWYRECPGGHPYILLHITMAYFVHQTLENFTYIISCLQF